MLRTHTLGTCLNCRRLNVFSLSLSFYMPQLLACHRQTHMLLVVGNPFGPAILMSCGLVVHIQQVSLFR